MSCASRFRLPQVPSARGRWFSVATIPQVASGASASPRGDLRSETIEPHREPRWQRFLESSANGSIFHHVEWLRLLHAQYRYPLTAFCVTDDDGEIVAGLPFARVRSLLTGTRLVAVPFSDACAPVLRREGDERALDLLLDSIRAENADRGTHLEIRAPLNGLPTGGSFYQHELALEADGEALRGNFSTNVRRGITRAQRDQVEVRRRTDSVALDAFYALHLRTRRRQGVPTQPKRFVGRFEALFERGLGFVLLAYWGGQPIAGAVFLSFNRILTYKYGASNPAHLDKRPNHAIFSEAIRWGCDNDQRTLDFGRTDLDHEGLRAFKRSWGADERELSYTRLPRDDMSGARGVVPGAVKTLISRTPAITGRLVGAALYRHFG
jgi:CelD/BcsL family acetyltransferase involved in cellulose biosynthesis